MIDWIIIIIFHALVVLTGYLVISPAVARAGYSRLMAGAIAWGVGLGVGAWLSLLYHAVLTVFPNPWVIKILGLAMSIGIFLFFRTRFEIVGKKYSYLFYAFAAILLLLVATQYLNAARLPLTSYDGRAIWNFKAKIIYFERTVSGEVFSDPYRVHYHRDYPLMMPLAWANVQLMMGHINDHAVRVIQASFLLFSALFFFAAMLKYSNPATAIFIALAYCGVIFRKDWMEKDGGALNQAAVDFPLAYLAVIAIFFQWYYWKEKHRFSLVVAGVFLGLCLLTKKEGVVVCAVSVAGNFFMLLAEKEARLERIKEIAIMFAIAIAVWVPGILNSRFTPNLYDEDYAAMMTGENIVAAPRRIPMIFSTLIDEFLQAAKWNYFWMIYPVVLLASVRRWRQHSELFLDAVIVTWLAAYVVVYCFSPLNLVFHLNTSITRLLTHILGIVAIRVALFFVLRIRMNPEEGEPVEELVA